MRIEVVEADATRTAGDVLALKYAQARYGVDAWVAEGLRRAGRDDSEMSPPPDRFRILPSPPGVEANRVLFVGVESLRRFEYLQIRAFARKVLATLAGELPETRTLVVTLHGADAGLDESEAFDSQVAGFVDATQSGDIPTSLELIRIVERNPGRAARLRQRLATLLPDGLLDARVPHGDETAAERLREVGYSSAAKKHVFVAMPYAEDMDDVYHYGIQNAVKTAGFLCERADSSAFTGEVMQWVLDRIRNASLVVADLTGANPNVYLELGYAWACGTRAVLLARIGEKLWFDVQNHRCLRYRSIKDLETQLARELTALETDGA